MAGTGLPIAWCPISRETFDIVMYSFLGVMKIAVIFLGLAPWLALLAMG